VDAVRVTADDHSDAGSDLEAAGGLTSQTWR